MRTARMFASATLVATLALAGAACESDDGTNRGATEDIVEETADNADEVGTEEGTGTEEPNTGDDVGDESSGSG